MKRKFDLRKQGYQESFAKSLWAPIANRDWIYAPILADMVSSTANAIVEVETIKEIIQEDEDTLIVIITRVGGREHRAHGE